MMMRFGSVVFFPVEVLMAVAALSTAGFTQYLAASSNVSASQQALQSLQQGLQSGNLSAALSAFNTYNQLNQNLSTASGSTSSGSSSSSTSQLATDMKALGSALNSGNLSTAQSAFATVQNDLKSTPSQAMTNAETAVNQTVQWVDDLLNLSNPSNVQTTPFDPTTAILDSAYGLPTSSTTTNPFVSILDNAYGLNSTGKNSSADSTTGGSTSAAASSGSVPASASAPSESVASPLARGNAGSGASVNAYA